MLVSGCIGIPNVNQALLVGWAADVDRSNIANGRVLAWNTALNKFTFVPNGGGGGGSGTVTSVGLDSTFFTIGTSTVNPITEDGVFTISEKVAITYNAAHTFDINDRARLVIMGNNNDFTIPNDTTANYFQIGESIDFLMQGTNEANEILVEAGVTLRWKGNGIYNPAVPLLLENFTTYTITKIAPNLWVIEGGSIA